MIEKCISLAWKFWSCACFLPFKTKTIFQNYSGGMKLTLEWFLVVGPNDRVQWDKLARRQVLPPRMSKQDTLYQNFLKAGKKRQLLILSDTVCLPWLLRWLTKESREQYFTDSNYFPSCIKKYWCSIQSELVLKLMAVPW